jgi:hypothetical protein
MSAASGNRRVGASSNYRCSLCVHLHRFAHACLFSSPPKSVAISANCFKVRLEVFHDFGGDDVWRRKIGRVFERSSLSQKMSNFRLAVSEICMVVIANWPSEVPKRRFKLFSDPLSSSLSSILRRLQIQPSFAASIGSSGGWASPRIKSAPAKTHTAASNASASRSIV